MSTIDLHVHSSFSDGTNTPAELVILANRIGLGAFALTDHDTLDGLSEAMTACRMLGSTAPLLIPGVEISVGYANRDIHVLGLFIDPDNAPLKALLDDSLASRRRRNRQMIARFVDAGIPMTLAELANGDENAIITRAHFAQYLVHHGYAKDTPDAFARYIGNDSPYYIPREYLSPAEAIEGIHGAGGVAILAHPLSYHFTEQQIDDMVFSFARDGIDGLEAIYGAYSFEEMAQVETLARRYGLMISGGSDYHGDNKPGLMMGIGYGELCVPRQVLTRLSAYRDKHILQQ